VVILHAVAQRQLHGFPPKCWQDDLKHAQLCLDALEFCGTLDPVALHFHAALSEIHLDLLSKLSEPPEASSRISEGEGGLVTVPPDLYPLARPQEGVPIPYPGGQCSPEYFLSAPPDANPRLLKHSSMLLYALCRPWGEPHIIRLCKSALGTAPLQHELDRLATGGGLGWASDGNAPFRWDTSGLGVENPGDSNEYRFLGSEQPSGWSAADDVEVYDEESDKVQVKSEA